MSEFHNFGAGPVLAPPEAIHQDGQGELLFTSNGYHEYREEGGKYSLFVAVKKRPPLADGSVELALEIHGFGAGVQRHCNYAILLPFDALETARRFCRAVDSGKVYNNLRLKFTRAPEREYQLGYLGYDGRFNASRMVEELERLGY